MTSMLLDLVHSDICGKMGQKIPEYVLTLLDDNTHYVWVYLSEPRIKPSNTSSSGRQK